MIAGLSRIILYLLVVILPVLLTVRPGEPDGIFIDVGRNLALTGFMILVLQFLIISRIKWIEKAFGLDILIRFHKFIAVGALCLLLIHPLLVAWGKSDWGIIFGLDLPWYIWAGKVALILLIGLILVSVYQSRIGLAFEQWRLGHNIFAPAILVLIFIHSWFAGDDLKLFSMQVLWTSAFILAAVVFVYHRMLRPKLLSRHPYTVQEVRRETDDVWSVKMVPPEGRSVFDYLPGQFHFLTFFRAPGLPVEEHHWTISSSPAEKDSITSTIKAVGDFTSTMGQTRPGDTVAVHGPFGRFSYMFHPEDRELVFLAGGIGITPVMSMLRYMRDTKDTRSVLLMYANRKQSQIIFRKEIDQIASGEHPDLTLVHVLSRPEDEWTGETGHLDRTMIEKYCGSDLEGKAFYICAPLKMAETLISSLQDMGVPRKRIRREIFSFLD
ncbi:MAG: ferric reductase-like transmembrane domain-containing protein [Desulfonatronovibrio sp.]